MIVRKANTDADTRFTTSPSGLSQRAIKKPETAAVKK
jgi:hypothetical protein